jgi:hypothetical protein
MSCTVFGSVPLSTRNEASECLRLWNPKRPFCPSRSSGTPALRQQAASNLQPACWLRVVVSRLTSHSGTPSHPAWSTLSRFAIPAEKQQEQHGVEPAPSRPRSWAARFLHSSRHVGQRLFAGRNQCHNEVVEIYAGQERIAVHARLAGQHRTAAQAEHHAGIPLGLLRPAGKTQVRIRPLGPEVEVRSLAAYDGVAAGGGR